MLGIYSSPIASLVLTDSFKMLPDQMMCPYAKPDDLQKHLDGTCDDWMRFKQALQGTSLSVQSMVFVVWPVFWPGDGDWNKSSGVQIARLKNLLGRDAVRLYKTLTTNKPEEETVNEKQPPPKPPKCRIGATFREQDNQEVGTIYSRLNRYVPTPKKILKLFTIRAKIGSYAYKHPNAQESFEPILKHLKIFQEDAENLTLLEQNHSYLDHSSWRSDSIV
uniref:(California timema) hypothetical protein n=1 Tax=Timema californicum TaxID=61474 RepID=A0A7R9J586_TIMCA|nr:unnamed protein product [Timema californicum]